MFSELSLLVGSLTFSVFSIKCYLIVHLDEGAFILHSSCIQLRLN
nr:MAG TPA: hypothetical protein [Caudoviricetes sp.]